MVVPKVHTRLPPSQVSSPMGGFLAQHPNLLSFYLINLFLIGGVTPGDAQGFLLILHSGIITSGNNSYGMRGMEPGLTKVQGQSFSLCSVAQGPPRQSLNASLWSISAEDSDRI